jgi:hypothetical protein
MYSINSAALMVKCICQAPVLHHVAHVSLHINMRVMQINAAAAEQ